MTTLRYLHLPLQWAATGSPEAKDRDRIIVAESQSHGTSFVQPLPSSTSLVTRRMRLAAKYNMPAGGRSEGLGSAMIGQGRVWPTFNTVDDEDVVHNLMDH